MCPVSVNVRVPELGSIKSDAGAILIKFFVGHHNTGIDDINKNVFPCPKFVVVDIVLAPSGFV